MKNKKGTQVFSENTDEILAEKIIEHTEQNRSHGHHTTTSANTAMQSYSGLRKYVTVALVLCTSLCILLLLLKRHLDDSE